MRATFFAGAAAAAMAISAPVRVEQTNTTGLEAATFLGDEGCFTFGVDEKFYWQSGQVVGYYTTYVGYSQPYQAQMSGTFNSKSLAISFEAGYESGQSRIFKWTSNAPTINDAITYVTAPGGGYDLGFPIEPAFLGAC